MTTKRPSPELTVRRHERLECSLAGYAQVAPEDAAAVRLARTTVQTEGIPVTVVDCSAGGIGLRSSIFIPRACALLVQASIATPEAAVGGGRALEALVRVQRIAMVDRRPTYYLGASFVELTDEQRETVNWLLKTLRQGRADVPLALPPPEDAEGGSRAAV